MAALPSLPLSLPRPVVVPATTATSISTAVTTTVHDPHGYYLGIGSGGAHDDHQGERHASVATTMNATTSARPHRRPDDYYGGPHLFDH
jgi:hypothetical protein